MFRTKTSSSPRRRWLVVAIATVATAGAMTAVFTLGTGTAAGAVSPGIVGRTGVITGFGGKCVDVQAANSANGTQVQLFTCNGTVAQAWTAGGSLFSAMNKCLDVAAAGTANGTRVQLFDCNGTVAQNWVHSANNNGLVNPNSGKCLDATGVSSADGTPLQIWDCTGADNQAWLIP
ncbi:MAG TPA: RICIN domain-containing protein [Pseudonocardiaceae bacterium]